MSVIKSNKNNKIYFCKCKINFFTVETAVSLRLLTFFIIFVVLGPESYTSLDPLFFINFIEHFYGLVFSSYTLYIYIGIDQQDSPIEKYN